MCVRILKMCVSYPKLGYAWLAVFIAYPRTSNLLDPFSLVRVLKTFAHIMPKHLPIVRERSKKFAWKIVVCQKTKKLVFLVTLELLNRHCVVLCCVLCLLFVVLCCVVFNVLRNCEAEGIRLQHISEQEGFKNGANRKQTAHLRMRGRVGVFLGQLSKIWHCTFQCERNDERKKREPW